MRPRSIILFLGICITLLGILCIVWPEGGIHIADTELRWPTLSRVLDLQPNDTTEYYTIPTDSEILIETDTALTIKRDLVSTDSTKHTITTPPKVTPDTTVDTRCYLQRFYQALAESRHTSVRIVHYGDSQIEEDRMTLTLRRNLQTQYGGGGVGLIPLHQTIPTRTIHQTLTMNGRIQSVQQGPKRNLVYGPKSQRRSDGKYGIMGQVAIMNDSICAGSEHLSLHIEPMGKQPYSERYFNRIRVFCEGNIYIISSQGDTISASHALHLPDSTTQYTLQIHGRGEVYGISIETPTGVIVDNIPMRGCLGTVFTNISQAQLAEFYRATHTRLIIMQFGGNAIPFNEQPSIIRGIVEQLRQQVLYLKACAPDADILFIGPGDMTTLIDGQPTTYPLLPYMDRLLLRMAQEEHIGYFSLYQTMGGKNSMTIWQKRGWAGSDGVHFTRKGAEVAGDRLWEYLYEGIHTYSTVPNDSIE